MARAVLLAWAEEERLARMLSIERRWLRDRSNPLELPEREFVAHFRLTKAAFRHVLEELRPLMPHTRRITAVRIELKILAALNFFANGSYQRSAGLSFLNTVSQQTFSRILNEVTNALNAREILIKYINFPSCRREREDIMIDFMTKFGFPGIIGCIDGTHVKIIRPVQHEESYINRRQYHSLNVLLICDADLRIMHIDASYPGSSHDSFVWNQSPIRPYLERLQNTERCWLLGDSGYAQRPWMMTPILGAQPGSPEQHYTDMHCRARNTVERCIGVLKCRWRCLLAHRALHYEPTMAAKIVNACVVLHNIARSHNDPLPDLDNDRELALDRSLQIFTPAANLPGATRDELVQRLFLRLR